MIRYKGYIGKVAYDSNVKVFHGDVVGLRHVITFEGTTPEEIEQSFKDAIDDYLEMCEEEGIKPERSFSGKFMLRLSPDLHEKLAHEALHNNKSLNEYVVDTLSSFLKTN